MRIYYNNLLNNQEKIKRDRDIKYISSIETRIVNSKSYRYDGKIKYINNHKYEVIDKSETQETREKTAKLLRYLDRKMREEEKREKRGGFCPCCYMMRTPDGICVNCD